MNSSLRLRALTGFGIGTTLLVVLLVCASGGARAAVSHSPADQYAVFGTAESPGDTAPGSDVGSGGESRSVATARLGWSEWATVDRSQICVYGFDPQTRPDGQLTPASACGSPSVVAADGGFIGVVVGWRSSGQLTTSVIGLVPDGVSQVHFQSADGSDATVRVNDNGVQFEATSGLRSISFTDSAGVSHTQDLEVTP